MLTRSLALRGMDIAMHSQAPCTVLARTPSCQNTLLQLLALPQILT
jgi:hypothetical protein